MISIPQEVSFRWTNRRGLDG